MPDKSADSVPVMTDEHVEAVDMALSEARSYERRWSQTAKSRHTTPPMPATSRKFNPSCPPSHPAHTP